MLLCTHHRVTLADVTVKQVKVLKDREGSADTPGFPKHSALQRRIQTLTSLVSPAALFHTSASANIPKFVFFFIGKKGPRHKNFTPEADRWTGTRDVLWRLSRSVLYSVINATYAGRLADGAVSVFSCHLDDLHRKKQYTEPNKAGIDLLNRSDHPNYIAIFFVFTKNVYAVCKK